MFLKPDEIRSLFYSKKNIFGGYETSYMFPLTFSKLDWRSLKFFQDALKKEAEDFGAPGIEDIYSKVEKQPVKGFKDIRFKCKLCHCSIRLCEVSGSVLLLEMDIKHQHRNQRWRTMEQALIDKVHNTFIPNQPAVTPVVQPQKQPLEEAQKEPQRQPLSTMEVQMAPEPDQVEVEVESAKIVVKPVEECAKITNVAPQAIQNQESKLFKTNPVIVPPQQQMKSKTQNITVPKPVRVPSQATNVLQLAQGLGFTLVSKASDAAPEVAEVIIGLTQNMKENLAKYGDVLSFETTNYSVVDNFNKDKRYYLGLFSVFDSNCRTLMAGIALYGSDTVASIYKTIKAYIKNIEKKPSTIITSQQPNVVRTMDILKEIGIYKGVHLVDRQRVLEQLSYNWHDQYNSKHTVMKMLQKLTLTGSSETAIKIMDDIAHQLPNENCEKLVMNFINYKDKLCMWSIPSSFVGIGFTSNNQIVELIFKKLGQEFIAGDLFKAVSEIDLQVSGQLNTKVEYFKEPLEEVFKDKRIKELRLNLESNVVKLFLKNYLTATKQYILCARSLNQETGEPMAIVQSRFNAGVFEIKGNKCSCDELAKTGVPCSHLITAVQAIPDSSYLPLFAIRWRRKETAAKIALAVDKSMKGK